MYEAKRFQITQPLCQYFEKYALINPFNFVNKPYHAGHDMPISPPKIEKIKKKRTEYRFSLPKATQIFNLQPTDMKRLYISPINYREALFSILNNSTPTSNNSARKIINAPSAGQ
ncbi:hypothetical protein NPIL_629081 [Nephila pilipes]|uniref:Uncharacterized protein n=1 Tax=Nephila pilipes TaxID=299642 RepID=A0A8X6QQI4_NEPPI|nr:hypothetical protein NPIL_629081 [Nephila pilipes]